MLFNSVAFAVFLPIVFILYWFTGNRSLKLQNGLLLFSSYFFYACWDWRFLFLLAFSTALDFYTGNRIAGAPDRKNKLFWLWLSISINLGFLGIFKYYNFFVSSFAESISYLGLHVNPWTLEIILPVGISFYTFHGLSYIIDLYYGRIKPEPSLLNYSVFVSFFPLLVAGPIERATHLLPQINKARTFTYAQAADGLRQILWGLFKKMVIADNCAVYADLIFDNPGTYGGSTRMLGAVFFAFQIYGDFSGYSDIAIGTAKLFGISLLRNFAFPYFSRDIAEFWRRWHISLSSWFRDYVYLPLGGSRGGTWMKVRNTFIIFLLSGLWHGANWTFLAWGALNAIYFLPLLLSGTNRVNLAIVAQDRAWPTVKEFFQIGLTFILTTFAWIFFRSETISDAVVFLSGIFDATFFSLPAVGNPRHLTSTILLVILFMMIEWIGRGDAYALSRVGSWRRAWRWGFYSIILFFIGLFMVTTGTPFIYFQF